MGKKLEEAIEIALKFEKMLNLIEVDYLEVQKLVNRLHDLKQQNENENKN